MGGSQGSESINYVFLEALEQLPGAVRSFLQVVHLTGKMSTTLVEEACAKVGVSSRAFSFFERMDLAYGVADFALGRAGATFLAEAKAKKIPSILVPYPFAGGHQLLNAKAFLGDGSSMILEQQNFSVATLRPVLERMIEEAMNKKKVKAVTTELIHLPNSRIKLMKFIEECAG